jgi:hypothetical protein
MDGNVQPTARFGDGTGARRGPAGLQVGAELEAIGPAEGGLQPRFKITHANFNRNAFAHGNRFFCWQDCQTVEAWDCGFVSKRWRPVV